MPTKIIRSKPPVPPRVATGLAEAGDSESRHVVAEILNRLRAVFGRCVPKVRLP